MNKGKVHEVILKKSSKQQLQLKNHNVYNVYRWYKIRHKVIITLKFILVKIIERHK